MSPQESSEIGLIPSPELDAKDNLAIYAWWGLIAYVLVVDVSLGIKGRKYMTVTFREALMHPVYKWLILAAWVFTTKHLLFGHIMPRLDPFSGIASLVKIINGN